MYFNAQDADKAREYLEKLITSGKRFSITEIKQCRTNQQNRTFHMWIGVFADFIGEEDRERVKHDVIRHLAGTIPYYSPVTGRLEQEIPHTSEMSTSQLSSLMDKFKIWALQEYNCYLPYYGDPGYEEMCQEYY